MPSPISSEELSTGQWIRNPENAEEFVLVVSVGHCEELTEESHCDTNISVTGETAAGDLYQFTLAPKEIIQVYLEAETIQQQDAENPVPPTT